MRIKDHAVMGLQFIIKAEQSRIELTLPFSKDCEIFILPDLNHGITIPTHVIDQYGEDHIRDLLSALQYYDLWAGQWLP